MSLHPALLAPVPSSHLASAFAAKLEQRVAFGSSSPTLASSDGALPLAPGTPVFLVPTTTGGVKKDFEPIGACRFAAEFAEWLPANEKDGKCPMPDLRPPSTGTDSAFRGYWVVTGLRRIPPISWSALLRLPKGKIFSAPRGPQPIDVSVEHLEAMRQT